MIDLRPHILKYQVLSAGDEDVDGNYVPGKSKFTGNIPCRAVLNAKASVVAFDDGTTFVYAYTVYVDNLPPAYFKRGGRDFQSGDLIQVWDSSGRMLFEKPIHGDPYHKQLHTKIYV